MRLFLHPIAPSGAKSFQQRFIGILLLDCSTYCRKRMSVPCLPSEYCRTHSKNMSSAPARSNQTCKHDGIGFEMEKCTPVSRLSLGSRNQSLAVVHFLKAAGLYLVNSCCDEAADRCYLNVREIYAVGGAGIGIAA